MPILYELAIAADRKIGFPQSIFPTLRAAAHVSSHLPAVNEPLEVYIEQLENTC